jgi:hypothetical protein
LDFLGSQQGPNGTLIGIKGDKKAAAVFFNVPAERHLSKCLLFLLTGKITRGARLEKNVVYVAKTVGEISDFVCSLYFHYHPSHQPTNHAGGDLQRQGSA